MTAAARSPTRRQAERARGLRRPRRGPALLWQSGEMRLHEAVDELQARRRARRLVAELGQDECSGSSPRRSAKFVGCAMMRLRIGSPHCLKDGKGRSRFRSSPMLSPHCEGDPASARCHAYDEMQCAPMLLHQIGHPIGGNVRDPRPLTDEDVTDIQKWLQHAGLDRIGRETGARRHRLLCPRARLSSRCATISTACSGTASSGSITG